MMKESELADIILSEWRVIIKKLEATKLKGLAKEMTKEDALTNAKSVLSAVKSHKGQVDERDVLSWFVGQRLGQVIKEVVTERVKKGETSE